MLPEEPFYDSLPLQCNPDDYDFFLVLRDGRRVPIGYDELQRRFDQSDWPEEVVNVDIWVPKKR